MSFFDDALPSFNQTHPARTFHRLWNLRKAPSPQTAQRINIIKCDWARCSVFIVQEQVHAKTIIRHTAKIHSNRASVHLILYLIHRGDSLMLDKDLTKLKKSWRQ